MYLLKLTLGIMFSSICAVLPTTAQQKPFIDWQHLKNPVLSYPNWSIKDAAMAYRKGTFYIFFSAFYSEKGRIRSHVVEVSTQDFKTFSRPILNFDGEEDGWIGMCSPDVNKLGDQYVMTFNSWGEVPPNRLFYMTSHDLVHWTARRPLAPNLPSINGVIDAALALVDSRYYLVYKEQMSKQRPRPRIASAPSLDGPYQFIGDGLPSLLMQNGKESGLIHENFQLIHADDNWYLMSSDHNPPAPYLYTLDPSSNWLKWIHGYAINVPHESFNTDHIADAGALYDWRNYDGYYYLIYAGRTEGETYLKRGWNTLGLARSMDLIHWSVPGDNSDSK